MQAWLSTGSPPAKASMQVRPPAFCTSTSLAAISAGMSSTHPSATPTPRWRNRWSNAVFRPQTITGTAAPDVVIPAAVCATSPTPQDPVTNSATVAFAGTPSSARLRARTAARSPGGRAANRGGTTGPVTTVYPAPSRSAAAAVTGCAARCRSTYGETQSRCTEKSVRKVASGARMWPSALSWPSAWLASG